MATQEADRVGEQVMRLLRDHGSRLLGCSECLVCLREL